MASDSNCDNCRNDYEFQKGTPMYVYLGHLQASNVEATCPHCQVVETIFLPYQSIFYLAGRDTIEVHLGDEPSEDIAERAEKTWAKYRKSKDPPELPRDMSRELFDTLREFGGEG